MSIEAPISNRKDALAAFDANKLYDLRGGSVAMCESFIDACRYLLKTPVVASEQDGESMELRPEIIKQFHDDAVAWYDANYQRLTNRYPRLRYGEADF